MYTLNNYDIKFWTKYRPDDGVENWFEFHGEGMRGDFNASIIIDDSQMTGGQNGTKPSIVAESIRKGSNASLFYQPIPNDMLLAPADSSQILLRVGFDNQTSDTLS